MAIRVDSVIGPPVPDNAARTIPNVALPSKRRSAAFRTLTQNVAISGLQGDPIDGYLNRVDVDDEEGTGREAACITSSFCSPSSGLPRAPACRSPGIAIPLRTSAIPTRLRPAGSTSRPC